MTYDTKKKPKGSIRDKAKRVLIIDGTPSFLYHKSERIFTKVGVNGHEYRLGSINENFIEELKKVPSFKVTEEKSERTYPISLNNMVDGVGNRTTIRKINGNTHIIVGAEDEVQLESRINKIKEFLSSNGISVTEKCGWICVIDKSKVRELSYDRAKEEVVYYLKYHNEFSVESISSYLMIDHKMVETILTELGCSVKKLQIPKRERTKKLRDMVINMGIQ